MIDPLPNVLKKLTNEVAGMLSAFEPGLRELIGHTNYNCLKMRTDAGRAALKYDQSNIEQKLALALAETVLLPDESFQEQAQKLVAIMRHPKIKLVT